MLPGELDVLCLVERLSAAIIRQGSRVRDALIDLSETCFHARVTYLFDNPATVFFAVFMSLWGLCFLFENYFHFFSLLFLYGINYYPFYSIFRSDSIFGIMEKIFGGNNSSMGFDEFGCSWGASAAAIFGSTRSREKEESEFNHKFRWAEGSILESQIASYYS